MKTLPNILGAPPVRQTGPITDPDLYWSWSGFVSFRCYATPLAQPPSAVPQRHQCCPKVGEQERATLGRYSNLDKSQHALNQSFGVSSLQLPCQIHSLKQHCTRTVFIFPWQKVKCYIFKTEKSQTNTSQETVWPRHKASYSRFLFFKYTSQF